jgi:mxaK protein
MKSRNPTGAALLPSHSSRWRRQGERDNFWLACVRWLRLVVQLGLLVCLVVALRAGWQLTEAMRWNTRLARQAEEFNAVAALGGATASGVLLPDATSAGPARSAAPQGSAAPADLGRAGVGEDVVVSAASSAGTQRGRERDSPRTAAAPVWADDVASAASAAAAAAFAAATAPQAPAWLIDGSPPQWRFGQGLGLARQGDLDGALARYRSVFDDAALGNLARYNSANFLLREAMRLSATAAPGRALVMFELAKEGYRSVLRRDPSFWAARYNLERALQLQPDGEAVAAEPAQQAERAATTMRSVSRGLP